MKDKSPDSQEHIPILVSECLKFFEGKSLRVFFDGTLGLGGHAAAILEAHPEIERYIGCDRDPEAIEIALKHLSPWKSKVEIVRRNFADLDQILREKGIQHINGFFLI